MAHSVTSIEIRSERLALRDFTTDDVDAAFMVVGDDRVTRWLSFDSRSRSEAEAMIDGVEARRQLVPRQEYYLAVEARDAGGVVGFARLGLDGIQAAKLGYAIAADHWGRGYASEAAQSLIDYGFRELRLHRISAAIGPGNAASITIADRTAMTYEGRIRDHVFTNGAWRDSLLYSILAPEWACTKDSDAAYV